MKDPPRAVLDTNAVVSALVFREGRLARLRGAWIAGRFQPLASKETTEELLRVLAWPKFRLASDERADLLADYLPWCRAITIPVPPPKVPACPDPDDIPFLRLALAGRAVWLVTGDAALLGVRPVSGFRIVRPEAFLEAIEGSG